MTYTRIRKYFVNKCLINNLNRAVITTLLCLTTVSYSMAQEASEIELVRERVSSKWIIGAKIARIDTTSETISDADARGAVIGYQFAKSIGNLGGTTSLELEYLTSEVTELENFISFSDFDVNVFNAFFTYRSAGSVYYKLKLGLSYSDFSARATPESGFLDDQSDDVAVAGGIGLGYRFGDFGQIEVDYSGDTGNNAFGSYGVSALVKF